MDPNTAIALAQTGIGAIQSLIGAQKAERLLGQRTAYKTPDEILKLVQASKSRAQQGFDAFTLNYLTGQVDRAFDQSSGTAARLGANPNDLAALFDQKIQATMKIGAENHALNLENFSKYLNALSVLGENKAAEWKSQQDLIKDKMQAANAEKQAGVQNMASGINAYLGIQAGNDIGQLYGNTGMESNRAVINSLQRGGIAPLTNSIRDSRTLI